jgi:hypothetical protein
MNPLTKAFESTLYIGWDVGAWHCDRPAGSQDAFCILERKQGARELDFLGVSRGNFRQDLLNINDCESFVKAAFKCVKAKVQPDVRSNVIVAIDAPLGVPQAFRELIVNHRPYERVEKEAINNRYLYRETERYLNITNGEIKPLSLVMHQIGSQCTKAIDLLNRLNLRPSGFTWVDNEGSVDTRFRALETYPAAAEKRRPSLLHDLRLRGDGESYEGLLNKPIDKDNRIGDRRDALICAVIAAMWDQAGELEEPNASICDLHLVEQEGWIWVPT